MRYVNHVIAVPGRRLRPSQIAKYLEADKADPRAVASWLDSLHEYRVTLRCMAHVARELDMPDMQDIVVAQTIAQTSRVRYDDVLRCWDKQNIVAGY